MTDTARVTALLHERLQNAQGGETALNLAALRNLINDGADVNAPDAEGWTPLLRCLSITFKTYLGDSPAAAGHEALSLLLEKGADLDALTPEGRRAQQLAEQWRDKGFATRKLACEAYRRSDPVLMKNFKAIHTWWLAPGAVVTDTVRHSFMITCHNGMSDEVRYILHHFPDAVRWTDNSWNKPEGNGLFACINHVGHRVNIAAVLLQHGCDVNWQNGEGTTALMLAATRGNASEKFIPLLVKYGADETLKNADGDTAMDLALRQGDSKYADALKAALAGRLARITRLQEGLARRVARQAFRKGIAQASTRQQKMRRGRTDHVRLKDKRP